MPGRLRDLRPPYQPCGHGECGPDQPVQPALPHLFCQCECAGVCVRTELRAGRGHAQDGSERQTGVFPGRAVLGGRADDPPPLLGYFEGGPRAGIHPSADRLKRDPDRQEPGFRKTMPGGRPLHGLPPIRRDLGRGVPEDAGAKGALGPEKEGRGKRPGRRPPGRPGADDHQDHQ